MKKQHLVHARKHLAKVHEDREQLLRDSVLRQAIDTCLQDIGGAQGFGEFMADTIQKAKANNSVPVRTALINTLRDWFKSYDELTEKSLNLHNIDDEDLHYIIISSVFERIREDAEFGYALIVDAATYIRQTDPDRMDELVELVVNLRDGVQIEEMELLGHET